MNSKGIKKHLNRKVDDWIETIEDEEVKNLVKRNAIITGGAIVSLLNGEKPNDYDVYFKNYDTVLAVANYYAKKWNDMHPEKKRVQIKEEVLCGEKRITCFIESEGIASEDDENGIDDDSEPLYDGEPYVDEDDEKTVEYTDSNGETHVVDVKPRYRPRYFTTNAISLSNKIQIVIRFYGKVEDIHKNYDFAHCTCSYDYYENNLNLPTKALECIINKELYYIGSKYPLCSIIRTRKFLSRGWHINAGQYVKMALQLNELDLKDFDTFRDQLIGVDSAYFSVIVDAISKKKESDKNFELDNQYLFEVINRVF